MKERLTLCCHIITRFNAYICYLNRVHFRVLDVDSFFFSLMFMLRTSRSLAGKKPLQSTKEERVFNPIELMIFLVMLFFEKSVQCRTYR